MKKHAMGNTTHTTVEHPETIEEEFVRCMTVAVLDKDCEKW